MNNLTIYKASAGSGKTYALTLEYLTLLLGIKDPKGGDEYTLNHPDFQKKVLRNRHRPILAITFTNKATNEMKERIVGTLCKISEKADPKDNVVAALTAKFKCTPEQLAQTAGRALRELLFDFDNFNVSTIDAFFQTVMRAMAYELDRPGDYEVSLEYKGVVDEGARLMLDALDAKADSPERRRLRGIVSKYMQANRSQGKGFNLFSPTGSKDITQGAEQLFDERYQNVADELKKWFDDNPHGVEDLEQALKDWRESLLDQNRTIAQQFEDQLVENYGENGINKNKRGFIGRLKVNGFDDIAVDGKEPTKWYLQIVEQNDITYLLNKAAKEKHVSAAITDELTTMAQYMADNSFLVANIEPMLKELPKLRFMHEVERFIEQYRADNNVVVLADTNQILSQIMRADSADVPFVYEKMGVSLHNLLIDEFQDTSRLQWHNLRPLLDNGLDDALSGGDSLIIGDEKQAIYRFRNSDSSMLRSEVEDDYAGRNRMRGATPDENTNRRSAHTVVRFNNTLFRQLAKQLTATVPDADMPLRDYAHVVQGLWDEKAHLTGYVRFVNAQGLVKPTTADNEDGKDKISADELLKAQLPAVLASITDQHNRGYRWGDIAVLVRTNYHASQVVQAMLENEIPVVSNEALLLAQNRSVKIIVAVMRMLLDSGAAVDGKRSIRRQLESLAARFDYLENQLLNQGIEADQAAAQAVKEVFTDRAGKVLDDLHDVVADIDSAHASNLITLTENIVAKRLPHGWLAEDTAYLSAFADIVNDFASLNGHNLVAFLKWWESNSAKLSISTPPGIDAVNVMTVHKAKGLEFDCVHLPFLGTDKDRTESEQQWIATPEALKTVPELEGKLPPYLFMTFNKATQLPGTPFVDEDRAIRMAKNTDLLNVMYVGFTRAGRELCGYYDPTQKFGADLVEAFQACGDDEGNPLLVDIAGHYNPETSEVTIGTPTMKDVKKTGEKEEEEKSNIKEEKEVNIIECTDYPITLDTAARAVTRVEALDAADRDDADDDDAEPKYLFDQMRMAEGTPDGRGTRLHYALSLVMHRGGLDNAVARCMSLYGLNPEEVATLRAMFDDNNPNAPAVARWFDPQAVVATEMPIVGLNDRPKPERRLDRLTVHDDGTVDIVDYKFSAEASPKHIEQVADYIAQMQKVMPGAQVNGYLWYVDQNKVVEVQQP